MSRKAGDNVEYTLRSLSNLMGEKRRRQAEGAAGSGAAAAGERSLIAAESCSSLNSAASGAELERAARRQFQRDETPGFVYVVSVFSALGGFLFGYDTGVVSGALLLLKRELNLDALWQELLVSGTVGAAALSALAGGVLNGLCGRRPCILLASGLFTAGAGVLAAARDKETLLGGRVVVGLGIGEYRPGPSVPASSGSPRAGSRVRAALPAPRLCNAAAEAETWLFVSRNVFISLFGKGGCSGSSSFLLLAVGRRASGLLLPPLPPCTWTSEGSLFTAHLVNLHLVRLGCQK